MLEAYCDMEHNQTLHRLNTGAQTPRAEPSRSEQALTVAQVPHLGFPAVTVQIMTARSCPGTGAALPDSASAPGPFWGL